MNKKILAATCSALCLFATACGSGGGGSAGEPEKPPAQATEGKLSVSSVYQYYGYEPAKIRTKLDGKATDIPDLYYYIEDESICSIENGYVTALKVGSTKVYAQTVGGQEAEFTVNVSPSSEFAYDELVREREETYRVRFKDTHPTLFIGDSFFDEKYCWTSFYDDFEKDNCFCAGLSGSQTTHWYTAQSRLITAFSPKNIVVHLGTNDINNGKPALNADRYYEIITDFLQTLITDYPDTPIYYYGIEDRNGNESGRNFISSAVTERIKTEFAAENATFTYLDSPSVFNADKNKYLRSDNIHPNAQGYEVYARLAKDNIKF